VAFVTCVTVLKGLSGIDVDSLNFLGGIGTDVTSPFSAISVVPFMIQIKI
jgi:hypothetical protein